MTEALNRIFDAHGAGPLAFAVVARHRDIGVGFPVYVKRITRSDMPG